MASELFCCHLFGSEFLASSPQGRAEGMETDLDDTDTTKVGERELVTRNTYRHATYVSELKLNLKLRSCTLKYSEMQKLV